MPDDNQGTVLVVEDDAAMARLERRVLERQGYRVLVAATPAEALVLLDQEEVKVLVLDQRLPGGVTGLEFYTELKDKGRDLPVILVTGFSDEATMVLALRAGVRDFITKSVHYLDYLPEAVERVLRQLRTEEALQNSEALYRSLVDSLPVLLYRLDRAGRFTFANQRFCARLGRPLQEILGTTAFDWVPKDLAEKYAQEDQQVMATGKILERVEEYPQPEGEVAYFQLLKAPVRDARGNIVGTQGILWDITTSKRAEKELRRLLTESQAARLIQQKLYPLAAPVTVSFDIGGASYPAQATGGDYFDFFPLRDQSLGIVVGDVSGHGFGPALLMAETRAYLRALAQTEEDLSKILALTNRVLCEDTGGDNFVTLFFGRLDPKTRTFHYASAGHPTGYILDTAGAVKRELPSTGPPLGLMEEAQFPCDPAVVLDPGDLLFFLTDGIVEALDPQDQPFDKQRALDLVRHYRHDSAQQIVVNLYHAVRAFSQNQPQYDDITAVIVKTEAAP
ncbi:MAG: SpoIIE family protein phosphatase [Planctomycetes bacterium]|nr:SpoIIE family protein phosphatase [Planctomycetota bacterium]